MKIVISIISVLLSNSLIAQSHWNNPIQKEDPLGIPLVETSPFVFKERLYLLENHQRFWEPYFMTMKCVYVIYKQIK